jgi:hypothetical protein
MLILLIIGIFLITKLFKTFEEQMSNGKMNEYREPTVRFINRVSRDFGVKYFNDVTVYDKEIVESLTNHTEELYQMLDGTFDEFDRLHAQERALRKDISELQLKNDAVIKEIRELNK